MIKKAISDEKFRISLRQSWKKLLTHFVWFRRKKCGQYIKTRYFRCIFLIMWNKMFMTPLPQSNVDPSHVVRSQCQIPQHWLMGAGKDYDKSMSMNLWWFNKFWGPLLSIEQCHASFSILVVNMGIVILNCIRCANYFFPWLSERNPNFGLNFLPDLKLVFWS